MRVLVDACVGPRVVEGLPGHEVKTAVDPGWHRLKDKELVPPPSGITALALQSGLKRDRGLTLEIAK
jgi:hypothetical protein